MEPLPADARPDNSRLVWKAQSASEFDAVVGGRPSRNPATRFKAFAAPRVLDDAARVEPRDHGLATEATGSDQTPPGE